jgi:acetyltransferase-like isoleucine patch superfamily enzyme
MIEMQASGISEHAVVQTRDIGEGVAIGEFCVIRAGAQIGNGVVIHPHVVIESGVTIGDGAEIFPGAYLGKEPKGAGALARPLAFERRVHIGAGSSVGPHAVIFYDVEIGANTLVGDGASIREQCRIGSKCVIGRYVTVHYNTTIGDRTKVMDLTHVTGNCKVGSDVFVSLHVAMVNDNAIGREGYSEAHVRGPTIGDGAAIGAGAILAAGVTVGQGAVVGAGSLVTGDVSPMTMVVGMPARMIRRLGDV